MKARLIFRQSFWDHEHSWTECESMIVEIPEYIMRNLTHDKELPRLVGMEWIAEPPEEKP